MRKGGDAARGEEGGVGGDWRGPQFAEEHVEEG